jgi:hypothetical protein
VWVEVKVAHLHCGCLASIRREKEEGGFRLQGVYFCCALVTDFHDDLTYMISFQRGL